MHCSTNHRPRMMIEWHCIYKFAQIQRPFDVSPVILITIILWVSTQRSRTEHTIAFLRNDAPKSRIYLTLLISIPIKMIRNAPTECCFEWIFCLFPFSNEKIQNALLSSASYAQRNVYFQILFLDFCDICNVVDL